MDSLKRAPNYTLVGDFDADRPLADVKKGDCIVCNGYEYLNLQVIPDGAVTITIGYWTEGTDPESAITAPTAETYTGSDPFEVSIDARGRRIALGVDVTNSAKILAAGFNWVNPD